MFPKYRLRKQENRPLVSFLIIFVILTQFIDNLSFKMSYNNDKRKIKEVDAPQIKREGGHDVIRSFQ